MFRYDPYRRCALTGSNAATTAPWLARFWRVLDLNKTIVSRDCDWLVDCMRVCVRLG